MPNYELTIVKTYTAKVVAENAEEAYEKVHNRDEYESMKCVEEITGNIIEIGKTNGLGI